MVTTSSSTARVARADLLIATGLEALPHERWMLGYASPADESFMRNPINDLLLPEDDETCGPAPRLTFYAQPASTAGPLDLTRVVPWLDPEKRRYEPNTRLVFVPMTRRGIADAVIALNDHRGNGRTVRSLVVRRTGTAEYGCYPAWTFVERKVWLIGFKLLVLQFSQFLRFLDDLAATFDRPRAWRVLVNANQMSNVVPVGYGEGWAQPFGGLYEVPRFWDNHFQLPFEYAGDPSTIASMTDEFADRIELAFGSTLGRARDHRGEKAGTINFDTETY
jgi:hypothetical protein